MLEEVIANEVLPIWDFDFRQCWWLAVDDIDIFDFSVGEWIPISDVVLPALLAKRFTIEETVE